MIPPRCPFCNAQGLDKITAKNLGYFSLIYCGQCGAIHGVVPLPPKKPKTDQQTRPVAYTVKQAPASSPVPPPEKEKTPPAGLSAEEALAYYTPTAGQHGFYTRLASDDE